MILPEVVHRNWTVVEPSLLALVSILGQAGTLLIAPQATTLAEYGTLFVGFLIFLGVGVLGIAGAAASYIVKSMANALTDLAGEQSKKVFNLPNREELDRSLKAISDASVERSEHIVEALSKIKEHLDELTANAKLINQEMRLQVQRADELRAGLRTDISALQDHVFNRRKTDQ